MQATVLFQIWRLALVWYVRPVTANIRPKPTAVPRGCDPRIDENVVYNMKD